MIKDTKEIEKKVIQILSDKLSIDAEKINIESKLVEDLGMDSFGAIEVAFELEDAFGIEIPDKDFAKAKLVKDIIDYIQLCNK